jgi:hypothetical protein
MQMNRKVVTIHQNKAFHDDEYVNLPARECISFVWELTREIYSLTGEFDVESRLQRNVVNIIRKQG